MTESKVRKKKLNFIKIESEQDAHNFVSKMTHIGTQRITSNQSQQPTSLRPHYPAFTVWKLELMKNMSSIVPACLNLQL